MVDSWSKLHRVDNEFAVHVAFDQALALIVRLRSGRFGNHAIAVVSEPGIEWSQGIFSGQVTDGRSVKICPNERAALSEVIEETFIVNRQTNSLGGLEKIGPVDKQD